MAETSSVEPQRARERRRILEATLETMLSEGYAQTTIELICERSGFPQATLEEHFADQADLMAATVAHLFQTLSNGYDDAFAALEGLAARSREDRVEVVIELLRASSAYPKLAVMVDIYAAARRDPALRSAVRAIVARQRERLLGGMVELFPEFQGSPSANRKVAVVIDALTGVAFRSMIYPDALDVSVAGIKELLTAAAEDADRDAAAR